MDTFKLTKQTQNIQKTFDNRTITVTVFWNQKCVLLVEFLQSGVTINATGYCGTLKRLRRAIQNKTRGLLASEVELIHDNAHLHSVEVTKRFLDISFNLTFLIIQRLAPTQH